MSASLVGSEMCIRDSCCCGVPASWRAGLGCVLGAFVGVHVAMALRPSCLCSGLAGRVLAWACGAWGVLSAPALWSSPL
eukprot:10562437-Alexandrium_andersonii.AAC.1